MAAQKTANPAHCADSGGARQFDQLGGAIDQTSKSPRTGTQIRAVKHLALYDGTRPIGEIIERADRTCIPRAASGKKLGEYPNAQKAADAIGEADKIFGSSGCGAGT